MQCDSERTSRLLELNRLLIEEKGDEFIYAFARYIQVERMPIGDVALMTLLSAARSVRRGIDCAQGAEMHIH